MTQAIVCCNHDGLVLATDSLVLQETAGGQTERLTERQVFALGRQAAIVTAGAVVGVELSGRLSAWLRARSLDDFDDVVAVSRDFISEGYASYLRAGQGSGGGDRPVPRHLYFILGGYCPSRTPPSAEALLLHSEAGELPLQETHLGRVFSVPRRLALEGRITRQIAEGVALHELAQQCLAGLQSAAERNPEAVGGPFDVAIISLGGVEFLRVGGNEPRHGPDEQAATG